MAKYDAVVRHLSKEDLADTAKKALTERDALRAQVAALVAAGERILEYSDIYSCKEGEVSPYEQLRIVLTTIHHQTAIAAAERSADA